MIKYSYELKKQVAEDYLQGKGGYKYLSKKYGVKSDSQVEQWIKAYREFGDEGIKPSKKPKQYSSNFKLNVVNLYLTTKISYQEIALMIGAKHPSLINGWVIQYKKYGPDTFQTRKRRNEQEMKSNTGKDKKNDAEYLKKLEEDNLFLRIENSYLKELRRLRLEEEANLNEKQESSTASEKNSN